MNSPTSQNAAGTKSASSFHEVWFGRSTTRVTVIAPAADDELPDALLTARNYSMFDRLGDRDSVYSVGVTVARRLPRAEISIMSSIDFDVAPLRENLIVVGGPGEYVADLKTWLYGNSVCRTFQQRIPSVFSYSADCETLRADGKDYCALFDDVGRLSEDYGVFRRFPNPFNRRASIVMIHGIHTLGVLGAALAFDGSDDSQENFATLRESTTNGRIPAAFECFFRVDVLNGQVSVPRISIENIYVLPDARTASTLAGGAIDDGAAGLSLADLRTSLISSVQVALNDCLPLRRKELREFLEECSVARPNFEQCQRALEICRSSPLLPGDAMTEIRQVLR